VVYGRGINFHQEDAEDVAMQVFTKVYLNLASYNSKQKFSSWIYRIAHNETVNFIKKNSRQWTVELTDFLPVFSQPKEDYFNSQILDKVLNNLKSNDKEILILFYLQELSLQEIGDVLKLTENSVAQRLRRARNRAKDEAKKLNL
jgi:RNA polymerase sigma-70 factor (ECF subfamily)